ncbi:Nin1 binding protein [Lobulomyces angularis]|nr:Nin1 binding protein [Lobulomyces angularis]
MNKIQNLVVDTAPFINNVLFANLNAGKIFTIPEVLNEVRDKVARENIDRNQFTVKAPSPEAFTQVSLFAKKTGDFPSLSVTDLKVLALTWMLEKEANNGVSHLRTEPLPPRTNLNIKKDISKKNKKKDQPINPAKETVMKEKSTMQENLQESADDDVTYNNFNFWKPPILQVDLDEIFNENSQNIIYEESDSFQTQNASLILSEQKNYNDVNFWKQPHYLPSDDELFSLTQESLTLADKYPSETCFSNNEISAASELLQEEESDKENSKLPAPASKKVHQHLLGWGNDDNGEWITPSSLKKLKNGSSGKLKKEKNLKVACMTSDFAMQNVILQMNMNLLSSDGVRITQVKTWILRCHACFKTTKKMECKFCPSCGNNTLIRTSVGIDQNGNQILYLKKNFQYNNRGTIYSIPNPKGGRKNNDLLLREDHRDYQKAVKDISRKQKKSLVDLFDPDVIPLDSTKWSNVKGPTIGYGRKNPNASTKKY